ncbi:MAG: DUF6262 family protein [Mycobacteriales bacterium]
MSLDASTPRSTAMVKGGQADSARRRERVRKALADAVDTGAEVSVSAIATRAGVDRTFLYRHRDLLEQVHTAEVQPRTRRRPAQRSPAHRCKPTFAPPSNAAPAWPHEPSSSRRACPNCSANQTWHASGLGAPTDIEELQRKIVFLEQQVVDLRLQIDDRDQELAAARGANRELMTQLNGTRHAR